MTGAQLAAAAARLVGTRFRLGGRDPATGLDCIGLLAAALGAGGTALPAGYPLRIADPARWLPDPAGLGFAAASGPVRPGDVVLLRIGPAQLHLAIAGAAGDWLHAHAGLRAVVSSPQRPAGTVLHHWRLLPPNA